MSVSNKELILDEIQKHVNEESKRLETEYSNSLADLKKEFKDRLDKETERLKESHKKEMAKLEKQKTSSFELSMEQATLAGKNRVYERVIYRLLEICKSENKIFEKFIEELKKESDVKEFLVPKECKIKDAKQELDEAKVIGVVSDIEEVERTVLDLLKEKSKTMHDIVEKELY